MLTAFRGGVLALGAALGALGTARAEWPVLAEEASNLPWGGYSISAGVSRTDQDSRDLPGGKGTRWTLPELHGTLGLGPRAEVSFDYDFFYLDRSGGGDAAESGDLRLWTKLVLLPGERQTLSLRFGVKLPNAHDENGLGTDETDFFASLLYGARAGPATVALNAGLGVLGDPERDQTQNDVFTWAAAVGVPVWKALSATVDASGSSGPFGVGRREDYAAFGVVLDWGSGPWRFSAAGRKGIEDAESWGWVAGVTYAR